MKSHKYNPLSDNLIIAGLAILVGCVIGVGIWLNLLESIGTIGTTALSLAMGAGVAGMIGLDDWLIWYKRWIIKKFAYTEGTFIMKTYDEFLKKHWVEMNMIVQDAMFDQDQNVFFRVFLNGKPFYMTFNPITGNPSLCNSDGIKFGSKLYSIYKLTNPNLDDSENLRMLVHEYIDSTKNNEVYKLDGLKSVSFNPDSFFYKNRKKTQEAK